AGGLALPAQQPDTSWAGNSTAVVKTYICPSEGSIQSSGTTGLRFSIDNARGYACCNYPANYEVFGNPGGQNTQGTARITTSFPDGTTNTVLFGEAYGVCGQHKIGGSLWFTAGDVNQ